MNSLHAKDLIIALLVIEHGSSEIIKDGVCGEWSICLEER